MIKTDNEDEEIERQHEEVNKNIKSENLIELYRHRTLLNMLLETMSLRCKMALSCGEKLSKGFDADQEVAIRETLKIVEKEIKKKEKQRLIKAGQ